MKLVVPKLEWTRIELRCFERAGYKCEICRKNGTDTIYRPKDSSALLICHEVWEFDKKKKIMRLRKFIALCHDCHAIKHFASSSFRLTRKQKFALLDYVVNFNRLAYDEFYYLAKDFGLQSRSDDMTMWKMDFSQWDKVVNKDRLKYFLAIKKESAIAEVVSRQ